MVMVAENWFSDQTSMLLNLIKTVDLSIFENNEVLISLTKTLYHIYIWRHYLLDIGRHFFHCKNHERG